MQKQVHALGLRAHPDVRGVRTRRYGDLPQLVGGAVMQPPFADDSHVVAGGVGLGKISRDEFAARRERGQQPAQQANKKLDR